MNVQAFNDLTALSTAFDIDEEEISNLKMACHWSLNAHCYIGVLKARLGIQDAETDSAEPTPVSSPGMSGLSEDRESVLI